MHEVSLTTEERLAYLQSSKQRSLKFSTSCLSALTALVDMLPGDLHTGSPSITKEVVHLELEAQNLPLTSQNPPKKDLKTSLNGRNKS